MLGQQLLNGITAGATYALFALGFTLMFGVLRVINLTYGFYFSAGAFIALFLAKSVAPSLWLVLPLTALITGVVAVMLDGLLLTRLRRIQAPELASLMVTLGATLLLYALMNAGFGSAIRRFPVALLPAGGVEIGGLRLQTSQMLVIGTALASVAGLIGLIERTRFGLALKALSENAEAARLMGVDTDRIVRLVSFLSGALGGTAGLLIGLEFNAIEPFMGEGMMLKGFAVIIIGGLGDIRGALVAGLLVGLLEALTAGYVASSLKDAVGFGLLVATLWLRPVGLFGSTPVRRA
jgi:branched-chain amino acid transport system permease protein